MGFTIITQRLRDNAMEYNYIKDTDHTNIIFSAFFDVIKKEFEEKHGDVNKGFSITKRSTISNASTVY